jgi:rare lipoprotein A
LITLRRPVFATPCALTAGALSLVACVLLTAGCADPNKRGPDTPGRGVQTSIPTSLLLRKPGGFYTDDGPDGPPPVNLDRLADAQPRPEALSPTANEAYSVFGRDYQPLKPESAYKRQGTASWYGRKFHGQRTASGEIYDMYAMTAAHPTLPIPSYARIVNMENQRSAIVRINDRGPFSSGRVMDVSYAAAYKLGFAESALAQIEVESIPTGPVPAPAPTKEEAPAAPLPQASDRRGIFLQLGAFSSRANAEAFRNRILREFGGADWMKTAGSELGIELRANLHRVQLGPFASRAAANADADRIREAVEIRPLVIVR